MKVVLFGATGMIGQGVLRECLRDTHVTQVLAVGRGPIGRAHPKLRELTLPDLQDFSSVADQLTGYDACFFCIGVTVAGMTEEAYRRITRDIAVAAARVLVAQNPTMTFVFVSGAGADSTERGRVMWARVKGEAENALRATPFKAVYIIRPGAVIPTHGIQSRTRWYRILYVLFGPLFRLVRGVAPQYVTTTEELGRAMIAVARFGAPSAIVHRGDFRALAKRESEAPA